MPLMRKNSDVYQRRIDDKEAGKAVYVVAVYDYGPKVETFCNDGTDLAMAIGDLVEVTDAKLAETGGWWAGINVRTKDTGIFPTNYVGEASPSEVQSFMANLHNEQQKQAEKMRERRKKVQGKRQSAQPAQPRAPQAKQAKVRKLVGQMAEAGVFAPETPDPSLAFAAFAVDRQPVDWVGVLQSLAEADYYHPGCDPERWSDNLAWGELPAGWREPGEGRVLAVLWEDETVIFSRVWSRSLAGLTAPMGKAEPWSQVDAEVLQALRDARISIG